MLPRTFQEICLSCQLGHKVIGEGHQGQVLDQCVLSPVRNGFELLLIPDILIEKY